MKKIILFGLLLITGCTNKEIIPKAVITPLAPVSVPQIAPLVMNPVTFKVVNSNGLFVYASAVNESKQDHVYWIMDDASYRNLMLNLNSINSYIGQQKTVIDLLTTINQQRSSEYSNKP